MCWSSEVHLHFNPLSSAKMVFLLNLSDYLILNQVQQVEIMLEQQQKNRTKSAAELPWVPWGEPLDRNQLVAPLTARTLKYFWL